MGNRVETTDRNGRMRRFSFDGLNRQTQEAWLDDQGNPLRTTTMVYDAADQLIAVQDPNSAYTFGYDALGRRVQVSNAGTPGVPTVVLSYGYDADGNVISVSDFINGVAGGVTTYTYDAEDRVTQMTQSGAGVDAKRVDFEYDAIGQFEAINRFSDLAGTTPVVSSAYSYDEHNRLERLAHSNGSGELAFYGFAYDDANRITQISDVDGVTGYSYNARHELTGADHSDVNNPDEVYDYDANGNRIESHLHGTSYGTGTNNQLVSDGIYTYAYDAEGNMPTQTEIATGNQRVFVWDYLNRLVAVIDENAVGTEVQRAEYVYDVMNRRIAKTVDSDGAGTLAAETLRFVYDRENVLLEFKGNIADPSMRYLHGPQVDQVLAQEDEFGTTLWHLTDHLGSVRDLVDDSGSSKNHRTFDSYGNVVSESNVSFDSRYGFAGREIDEETGLYYYRARYYDGELGRFISEDPIGFQSDDENLYRYVGNRPVYTIDPSGKAGRVISQERVISYRLYSEDRFTTDMKYVEQDLKALIASSGSNNVSIPIESDTTTAEILWSQRGGPRGSSKPYGDKGPSDENGHIFPRELGGRLNRNNFFAQRRGFNQAAYKYFGGTARAILDIAPSIPANNMCIPNLLQYRVSMQYDQPIIDGWMNDPRNTGKLLQLRPTSYTASYFFTSGFNDSITLRNPLR